MSFGWSTADAVALAKLAYTTVQNCRKACGEYDDLTRQVQSLRGVVRQLRDELANPRSLLNRTGKDACWEELRPNLEGSREVLRSLNVILVKYASINRKDKMIGRLWTRAKFGNKELGTLNDLRQKAKYYTGAISTLLNTVAVGSLGRIENSLNEAGLKDIKPAIESIAGKLMSMDHGNGSVLTAYTNDDRAVWKELRRELVKENIVPSDIISKNKGLITRFIRELGERGILDDPETHVRNKKSVTGDVNKTQIKSEIRSCLGENGSTEIEACDTLQDPPSDSERHKYPVNKSHRPSVGDAFENSSNHPRESRLPYASSSRQAPGGGSDEESLDDDDYSVEPRGTHYSDSPLEDTSYITSSDLPIGFDPNEIELGDKPTSDKDANLEDGKPLVQRKGLDRSSDEQNSSGGISIGSMLKSDLGHRMPELVANMSSFEKVSSTCSRRSVFLRF